MIFEHLIKENKQEFIDKLIEISAYLAVKPEWLIFLMWIETARTLDHRIQNNIGATGLIQFMPKTAKALGTTTEELKNMSNVEQLEYVKKYLSAWRGKYTNWLDLYCAIFWPAAIGKPLTYRITSDIVAKQNPMFDLNKDLDIEKSEIRDALLKRIPDEHKKYFI